MKFYTLTTLLLPILFGCSVSKVQYTQEDYIRYSDNASYIPSGPEDIYGCYYSKEDIGGITIKLLPEDSYFFHSRSSLSYHPDDPTIGHEGFYEIQKDTLTLNFTNSVFDQSMDSTRIADIKQFEGNMQTKPVKWLFKRFGNTIFLIPEDMNSVFGEFALENNGVPMVVVEDQKTFGKFFPVKVADSKCDHEPTN